MELIQLDPPRNKADFVNALHQLLPPGDYWHSQESTELQQTLEGIATELKTIHDDTKLTFLYEILKKELGWTIADYQSILDQTIPTNIDAIVIDIGNDDDRNIIYDDQNYPNIIFVLLQNTSNFLTTMQRLESHHLPHTQLAYNLVAGINTNAVARCINHIRLETQEI